MLSQLQNYITNTKKDWNYVTPVEFFEKIYEKQDYVLVDLRKKEDYDNFHIKDAINIFWLDLLKEENLVKIPKHKKIYLICYVGHTSSQAMVLLKLLGYDVKFWIWFISCSRNTCSRLDKLWLSCI